MTSTLEALSWIASIIGVPVAVVLAVIGWSVSGKAVSRSNGTAVAGDVRADTAGIVTGHNSVVNVTLAVDQGRQDADHYETRHAILRAVDAALEEVECDKMISPGTFQTFSKAVTDSRFLFDDDGLVAYLNEVRGHAAKLQAYTIAMNEIPPGDRKACASAAVGEQRRWLMAQVDGLPKRFEPVLRGLR